MAERASGPAGERVRSPVPALPPEADIGATFVIPPAGTADALLFGLFHQGLTVAHILCYSFAHERYGSFR